MDAHHLSLNSHNVINSVEDLVLIEKRREIVLSRRRAHPSSSINLRISWLIREPLTTARIDLIVVFGGLDPASEPLSFVNSSPLDRMSII